MKKIIFLLLSSLVLTAAAQTTPNKIGAEPDTADTQINSDRVEYRAEVDKYGGLLVYSGHVVVENPQIKILSDRLVVWLPKSGEQPEHIEAQTNVVIVVSNHGQTTRATGNLAVYALTVVAGTTNETVTLTGNPYAENAKFTITGDAITWDRRTGGFSATNQRQIIKLPHNSEAGSNQPAVKLF